MNDEEKTRDELIAELRSLRTQVAELESDAERRDRFRRYFEHAPDGVFVADQDGVYVEVNPAACQITGYTEDELVGMGIIDIVTEDDREYALRHFAELSQAGIASGRPASFRRKDGSRGFFSVTAVKLSETRFLGFVRDVSEQRTAERALRRSEEKFRKIFNNRGIMMTISSIDEGRYDEVNDSYLETTGFDREQVIGATSVEIGFLSVEERQRLKALLAEEGRVAGVELELRRRSGEPLHCLYFGEIVTIGQEQKLLSIAIDVTRHHEAERSLSRSEQFLKSIYDHGDVGIFVVDVAPDGSYRYAGINRKHEELLGVRHEQIEGKGPDDLAGLFDADQLELIKDLYDRAVETKEKLTFEHQTPLWGEERWWISTISPLLDESGRIWRLVGTALDVTDRHRVERALEDQRALYSALFEASPTAILVVQGGCYTLVNPAGAAMLGYDHPDEIKGAPVMATIAPESQPEVLERLAEVTVGKPNSPRQLTILRRDGARRVTESTSVPVDLGGEPSVLIIGRDVTEQLAAEEALRESETRYRTLFHTAQDAIFVADATTGAMLDCNRAGETLIGRPREVLRQLHQTELHPLEEAELYRQEFAKTAAEPGRFVEHEVVHSDGRRIPVEISSGGTVKLGSREVHIGIFRDISERKAAEAHRRELERQLVQAQKLEAIGRLAGGIAHDFNNLLTGIMGNISLALMDLEPGTALYETLSESDRGASRAAALVHQLLAFSRRQRLEPRLLSLDDLLGNLDHIFNRLIGEDIELVWDLTDDLWSVEADPAQLEQVVVNLVVNARDAMPDGGKLTIRTTNREEEGARLVTLSVADTGEGMDETTRERIFEPFFTTKHASDGTGLGLATAYGVVSQHGGRIEVDSTVGVGTTFTVFLPVATTSARPVAKSSPPPSLPTGRESILVVEDEPAVRKIAIRSLERQGYRVHHADSGQHALALSEQLKGEVDLLLTDVVMPGMNGRELAEQLLARFPSLRVVFTSGYTDDIIAHHGVLEEGIDFLPKPYSPTSLTTKVREVLDRPR